MVQKLEAMKGGGGSIKVGTTGTIGVLMSKELESVKSAPQTPSTSRNKPPFTAPTGVVTPKRLKPRTSMDEASSSGGSNSIKHNNPEIVRKTKRYNRKTHQIPMLNSDNISLDGTPIRAKPDKKVSYIVEVVDIKCGNSERKWASPITNRLKKLGFSKLSESIM